MNTTRDVLPGSDIRTSSGCEVESASFFEPIGSEVVVSQPRQPGIRGKAEELKERGLAKAREAQRVLKDRSTELKESLIAAKNTSRNQLQSKAMEVKSSMRSSPMKWAGIAAGSGLAIGLLGRMAHWRRHHRRMRSPDLVIIDATC